MDIHLLQQRGKRRQRYKKNTKSTRNECLFAFFLILFTQSSGKSSILVNKHLLKIEVEDHHICRSTVHALRKDKLRGIRDVVAVLFQDITQPEAELDFGDKLEERHIKVASQSHLKIGLEGLCAEFGMLGRGKVVLYHGSRKGIGTVVVVAAGTELEIDRNGDVGRLHVLALARAVEEVDVLYMLRPEIQTGIDAHVNVVAELETAENSYTEPEVLPVAVRHPLVAGFVDISVAHKAEALVVDTDIEAIVPTAGVDEGFVLYLALLCPHRKGDRKAEKEGKQP